MSTFRSQDLRESALPDLRESGLPDLRESGVPDPPYDPVVAVVGVVDDVEGSAPMRYVRPDARNRHIHEGEEPMILSHRRIGRFSVVGAAAAGALAGAMLFGGAAVATAQPPPPKPPNCTPADWAGVRAGVAAATSAYLFTHPPVNDFFATLEGQSREEMQPQVQKYLDANPQVRAELQSIKQPAVDFLDRCK